MQCTRLSPELEIVNDARTLDNTEAATGDNQTTPVHIKSVENDEEEMNVSVPSSKNSTRRNSSSSSLGTPLHVLFGSSRNSSQFDSPTSSVPDVDLLNGLDQLLNRVTSERFLELRRIQLGDRPVTSGNARDSLEDFFHRAIHGPTIQQQNNDGERNRPENVSTDVESLLQLSRVRSALQNGFRNQLEATLTGRVQMNGPPQPRVNRIQRPSNRIQSSAPPSNNLRHGIPPPPPLPSTQQQQQQQQQQQPSVSLQDTVQASVHMLTESIATDLTRLQSLQVVNNMLRTDFRQELETMMQERVESTGNGEAVAQFIRTLPTIQRRSPTQQQRLPTIDERSTSSGEIHQLRQQLQEMKQMMAMSMEIQLDTQRAIRQEVSAIFTAFMKDYLAPRAEQHEDVELPTLMHPNRSTPIQRGQCVICVEQTVNTVLYQCGHMCVCNACGLQLKMNNQNCPMCRAPIRDVIRAYVIDE